MHDVYMYTQVYMYTHVHIYTYANALACIVSKKLRDGTRTSDHASLTKIPLNDCMYMSAGGNLADSCRSTRHRYKPVGQNCAECRICCEAIYTGRCACAAGKPLVS